MNFKFTFIGNFLFSRDVPEFIKSPKRNAPIAIPIPPIKRPERFLNLSSEIICNRFFVHQVCEYTKVLEN